MASQPEKLSAQVAPTAGLEGKDVKIGEDSLQGTTPSVRSEELVVGDYGSDSNHAFSDPKVADYWRGVYEKAQYEGRHRFDPTLTWSADEEKKLKRRVDYRIMTWCWVMFLALDLNRRNINRAISDDMLEELGMDTNDFNTGQTIFLVSFLAAELPSGLISKKLGPDIWIPFIIFGWSVTSAAQAGLSNKAGYYACRCILGLLMGGFIPDTVLYITYWYKTKELPIRLSWFWTVLSTCNILGSLLAAGILQMRGLQGWSGWQWLFLIEGCITAVVGIASWGLMPASISQTKGWLRGKNGWFTEREEAILVNRLLRDDPSKGDMNNRQAVTLDRLWKCIKDYDLWPLYLIGLTTYIPPSPPQNYLSLILRQMGFSTFNANLLTIPSQFMFGVNLLIISRVSEWLNERALVSSLSNIWIFPWLAALVALGGSASEWVRYALLTGLLSYPYCHAIVVSWNSRNSNSVRTRAVSAALYNMFVQSGNIIGVNIYREDDRPHYIRGNRILLGICCFNIVLFVLVKFYYIGRNKRREEAWAKLTGEEKVDYVRETEDEGAKRLDFRFSH
ncbi:Putative major facilitator superfamily, MFS transporter superfamily [Septoria linicola]|uniref:Major facilitator superfamily, MFS transporter superfamily n=1 Tax=Septoria linicola TaxID=215465 RepID=A0A9Q9ARY6_9PEZI|nr:Putative major facilitator superfamily, MFS transporter superfamily [Septoria linicola]